MKYRIDYEMTHDIDFFFKYKGKYYHAASNGQRLPSFIDSYFSEIVGKKKELLEGLEIPFPEAEMDIEYEEDIAAEAEENLD